MKTKKKKKKRRKWKTEGRAERGVGSRFYTEVEREDAVTKRVGH